MCYNTSALQRRLIQATYLAKICRENYKQSAISLTKPFTPRNTSQSLDVQPLSLVKFIRTRPLLCSVQNGDGYQQEAEGLYRLNLLCCSQSAPDWAIHSLLHYGSCSSVWLGMGSCSLGGHWRSPSPHVGLLTVYPYPSLFCSSSPMEYLKQS